jgi:hypothetical protein
VKNEPIEAMEDMLRSYSPEDIMAAAAYILGSMGFVYSGRGKEEFLSVILFPIAMAWDIQNEHVRKH